MGEHDERAGLTGLIRRVLETPGIEAAREGIQELAELASYAWKERAHRRKVHIEANLRQADEPDANAVPVRIVDISASGVRVRLPRSAEIDVMRADRMYLNVTLESPEDQQVLGLFVSFVRVATMEDGHAELAFRFTYPSEETDRKLDRIHAHYFSE